NRFLQGLLFIPILGFLIDLADLPVGIAWHALSLHYEQSVQQWGSWLFDRCKAELIDLAFLTLLGLILFLVIRKSPQRWWFYFWLAALPIVLGVFILEPVVIDPLFYKFEPLAHQYPEFTADLQKLTQRAGLQIPRERMFLMNASIKTNAINGDSRMQEHNADIFGLELAHGSVPNSSQVAAHAFQAMGEIDLADPNPPPFITFWMYSHPPLAERLVFAHSYDPWGKNQATK